MNEQWYFLLGRNLSLQYPEEALASRLPRKPQGRHIANQKEFRRHSEFGWVSDLMLGSQM